MHRIATDQSHQTRRRTSGSPVDVTIAGVILIVGHQSPVATYTAIAL
jgi:hypothetical protein